MYLLNLQTILVHINFLYTSQVLRIFILILLWNQGMLHYLRMCSIEGNKRKLFT